MTGTSSVIKFALFAFRASAKAGAQPPYEMSFDKVSQSDLRKAFIPLVASEVSHENNRKRIQLADREKIWPTKDPPPPFNVFVSE
jgi:hypothetical protein